MFHLYLPWTGATTGKNTVTSPHVCLLPKQNSSLTALFCLIRSNPNQRCHIIPNILMIHRDISTIDRKLW